MLTVSTVLQTIAEIVVAATGTERRGVIDASPSYQTRRYAKEILLALTDLKCVKDKKKIRKISQTTIDLVL